MCQVNPSEPLSVHLTQAEDKAACWDAGLVTWNKVIRTEVCNRRQRGSKQRSATHCRDGGCELAGRLPVLPVIVAAGRVGVRVGDDVEKVGHGREAALVARALKAGRKPVHLRGSANMASEEMPSMEGCKNGVKQ